MLDQRISIAQSPHSPQPDDWDGEPRKVASRGGSNLLQKNTGRRELDWWFDIGFLNTYVFRTDDDDDDVDDDDDDMVLFSGHDSWLIVVFWLMIDGETNLNLPVWGVVVSQKKQTTEMTRVA